MERLTALWSRTPRWVHGLVLGNLGFFANLPLAGLGPLLSRYLGSEQLWPLVLFLALLWPFVGSNAPLNTVLYYGTWSVLGALFVQWFGEVKGMIVAFCLIYAIGIALSLYMLTHISFTVF